ncbi:hypothetical protein BY996DRAFT_6412105 [Phakopsora pachyrhizi]|nr:hypothetical protein BY996DRAFT_6412105 [Phakopsora pachyrhizi]
MASLKGSTVIAMSTMDSANVQLFLAVRTVVNLLRAENYQMCNVTSKTFKKKRGKDRRKNSPPKFFKMVLILNDAHSTTFYNNNNYIKDRKILDMLLGRLSQVSFTCDIPTSTLLYKGNKQSVYSTTLMLRMVFL